MSKSDLSVLNAAAGDITREACIRNVTADMEAQAAEEAVEAMALAAALEKKVEVDDGDDDGFFDDDLENDPTLASLQAKRLAEMKARYAKEKAHFAAGHGEYREIAEDEFLKEVCGSEHVVVHFYHTEFFRCKIVDKHLRALAPKHRGCKFLYLNADKSPFFVSKLCIQTLPTLVVFKDGVKTEMLVGFEELGGKDTFRTEVLEHWLGKAGCVKLKQREINAFNARCCDNEHSDASDRDGECD